MSFIETTDRRNWLKRTAAGVLAAAATETSGIMAENPSKLRVIDPHVHVWKNDPAYPWAGDLKEPPKEDALPTTLLELMRANGVEKTVIVHVIYYRWDCRYTAHCVRERRDKFMGVCRVDPQSPNAVADLNHWTGEEFHGVRLSPADGPAGDWINDRRAMDAIWGRTAELRVPMCVLCSISRIPDVAAVIERHPNLDVCIDHMADCPIDESKELDKLLALARYPRVHVKLSHLWSLSHEKYPYLDTHRHVRRLYDAFGPRRLMWGTDWPGVEQYCGYARALALYRDEIKFLNDEDRRWILGETALTLWPFASAG